MLLARAVEASKSAHDYSKLYDPLKDALKAAGGKHSNLVSPQTRADVAEKSPLVDPTVTVDGGVVIATVPEFDSYEGDPQNYTNILAKGLDKEGCGRRLRRSSSICAETEGSMGPMLAGLAPLLPDGTALEFVGRHSTTPVTISGASVIGGGTPTGVEVKQYTLPVAVLTDGDTASSGRRPPSHSRVSPMRAQFRSTDCGICVREYVVPDARWGAHRRSPAHMTVIGRAPPTATIRSLRMGTGRGC